MNYHPNDPRAYWDGRAPDRDARVKEIESYLVVARKTKDDAAIETASKKLDEARATLAAYTDLREKYEQLANTLADVDAKLADARNVRAAGEMDDAKALENHSRVICLEAKNAFVWRQIDPLRASINGTLERVIGALYGGSAVDKHVVEQSLGFVEKLFDYSSPGAVLPDADEAGRKANAAQIYWWPVGDHLAREAFAKKLAEKKNEIKDDQFSPERDPRREPKKYPTLADLEACFARRRQGFEAEKARLRAEIEKMTGNLASLGGAST